MKKNSRIRTEEPRVPAFFENFLPSYEFIILVFIKMSIIKSRKNNLKEKVISKSLIFIIIYETNNKFTIRN